MVVSTKWVGLDASNIIRPLHSMTPIMILLYLNTVGLIHIRMTHILAQNVRDYAVKVFIMPNVYNIQSKEWRVYCKDCCGIIELESIRICILFCKSTFCS